MQRVKKVNASEKTFACYDDWMGDAPEGLRYVGTCTLRELQGAAYSSGGVEKHKDVPLYKNDIDGTWWVSF